MSQLNGNSPCTCGRNVEITRKNGAVCRVEGVDREEHGEKCKAKKDTVEESRTRGFRQLSILFSLPFFFGCKIDVFVTGAKAAAKPVTGGGTKRLINPIISRIYISTRAVFHNVFARSLSLSLERSTLEFTPMIDAVTGRIRWRRGK